jgi:aspartyl-tRNA(Asn)/glutamyl-tRNA(Gln) amidotransferase subunit A
MFLDCPSLKDLVKTIRQRRISPVEVVAQSIASIERSQPQLNAFISVSGEAALEAARRLERRLKRGDDAGPLAGVPLAVKDLVLTRDALTTAGSRIHGAGLSGPDAEVVARLRRAGAVIVGKTNLHEVALGVTTVNEHFGPARNPWDLDRVSGGSSGGSAVAVAADLCPAALGTDTRGSIRIPAACCGITGFKPSFGLASLDGVLPLAASLDHVGPMTRSVEDAALVLAAMLKGARLRAAITNGPRKKTRRFIIGVSEYHLRNVDSDVGAVVQGAINEVRALVREVREVRIPELEGVQEASGVIAGAEAVTLHDENLRMHPEDFGPVVRSRLEGGYKRSAVEYLQALEKRERVKRAFASVFEEVDLLVGATLPVVPPPIAAFLNPAGNPDVSAQVIEVTIRTVEDFTRFNSPQNVAGLPSLSVPCGFAGGLPVGFQLFGASGADVGVLALGGAFQRATDWHLRTPAHQT